MVGLALRGAQRNVGIWLFKEGFRVAISNLSSIVNATFVKRFSGLSGQTSTQSLTNSNSSSTSISSGLRFGAQTFARAIQGLNAGISYLNISKATLESLTKVTDKMILLTEKAMKISTSSDARKNLNLEFKRLASKFEKVAEDAKFGERDVLDVNEMEALFTTLGLDQETSQTIAEVFKKFTTPEDDENLASQAVKGSRPYRIPASAYRNAVSDSSYYLEKISDGPMTAGGISTVNNVFTASDDILNQNPGQVAVFTQDTAGSLTTMDAGTLSSDVTLQAVNESTGYSVIESTEDFLGFNGSGFNQLFVVDAQGQVVHQVTNESSSVDFTRASITSDNLTVAYARLTGADLTVHTATTAALGNDPATSTDTTLETLAAASSVRDLQVNNAGSYVGYIKTVGGLDSMQLRDTAGNTPDAFLAGLGSAVSSFGFYDNDKIAVKYDNGVNYDVKLYTDGAGSFTNLKTGVAAGTFTVLEKTTGSQGYVAYYDTVSSTVAMYGTSDGSTVVASHALGAGDSLSSLAMAFNSSGQAEVMIGAALPSYTGDSDTELYRLKANAAASSGSVLARSSAEYEEIFDGTLDIASRPNAYRMLHDLKALREEMHKNMKGIDYAVEVIGKNIDLVRASGFAFLNLSSSISSSDDAEKVAALLRDEIRKNARGALAQAENLENIVVASLALNEDSLTKSGVSD